VGAGGSGHKYPFPTTIDLTLKGRAGGHGFRKQRAQVSLPNHY
jgi:hypothetical protein